MQGITSASSSNVVELRKPYPSSAGDTVVKSSGNSSAEVKAGVTEVAPQSQTEQTNINKVADKATLNSMLDKVNRQMELNNSSLRFQADESSGKMVVAIYDAATDEIIRQIPSEQALSTAQKLNEFMERSKSDPLDASSSVGLLLNSQA